jgi:hypothetical protein
MEQTIVAGVRELVIICKRSAEKRGAKSLLQNCLQSADMRQGTTSVVPQMVHSDSGFSRCGIVNRRKQIDTGAKAQHLSMIFRHD